MTEAGYRFEVLVPHASAESGVCSGELPAEMVARLAYQKAADVAARCADSLVIACDTVVECRGRMLGKPRDRDDARDMLRQLRGSVHHVYSGLCLRQSPDHHTATRVAVTQLRMRSISDEQLEQYLDTGDWEGKAGAFGYQDRHDWLWIEAGSESNVVGLPLELLAEMLRDLD
jgi:septum formation protein